MEQPISLDTLLIAIPAVLAERSRLLARIAIEPAEVDDDEHLSEQVMDIDRALGELGSQYEKQRAGYDLYPNYQALLAAAIARTS